MRFQAMRQRVLAAVFILLGLLAVIHHFYFTGRLFDLQDVLHHEFFEGVFFTAGLVLLANSFYARK